MKGETLVDLFLELMKDDRQRPCLYAKKKGVYTAITAQEVFDSVQKLSSGLKALGLQPNQKVALLSENRPEWLYIDMAVLALGAIDVPIYTSNTPQQIRYILDNSESCIAFSSASLLNKILEIRGEIPSLKHLICLDEPTPTQRNQGVRSLEEIYSLGNSEILPPLPISKDQVCTIIYTSGTTGNPKGVMLTHHNFVSNLKVASSVLPITQQDRALSFLPLCHVFERTGGYYAMFFNKAKIYYAESIETVSNNMLEVKPTFMFSVPRLYEKMYARMKEKIEAGSGPTKKIFSWATKIGKTVFDLQERQRPLSFLLKRKKALADRFVFRKIRERTGGALRYFISGGAPLNPRIAEFFDYAGIIILEGYGLTETSPILTCNLPTRRRIGSVGPPIPGVEIRIADDGEIVARGPNIMKGYYKNEAATQEVLDPDGWFHTGDIGYLDPDGFLHITDRKKDLLVTSGGKKIAPQNLENLFKTDLYLQEFVVVGDQRNYCSGLVVPHYEKLTQWAKDNGINEVSRPSLAQHPKINEFLMNRLRSLSKELASFEQIKKICILEQEFSIEAGELTPTLKIKRKFINEKYKAQIEALYANP
ncbi:MAG: long-chain fatty acid--CoA ligase [Planctomycetota bacterium]